VFHCSFSIKHLTEQHDHFVFYVCLYIINCVSVYFLVYCDLYVLYVLVTDTSESARDEENVKVKFETLRAMEQAETIDIDSHMSDRVSVLSSVTVNLSVIHC
jgi:hypothetical protein